MSDSDATEWERLERIRSRANHPHSTDSTTISGRGLSKGSDRNARTRSVAKKTKPFSLPWTVLVITAILLCASLSNILVSWLVIATPTTAEVLANGSEIDKLISRASHSYESLSPMITEKDEAWTKVGLTLADLSQQKTAALVLYENILRHGSIHLIVGHVSWACVSQLPYILSKTHTPLTTFVQDLETLNKTLASFPPMACDDHLKSYEQALELEKGPYPGLTQYKHRALKSRPSWSHMTIYETCGHQKRFAEATLSGLQGLIGFWENAGKHGRLLIALL